MALNLKTNKNMSNNKASGLFSVNLRERVKALTITVIGTIATAIYQAINESLTTKGSFPITWLEWQPIILTAISTGVSAGLLYFGVTFTTNANKQGVIEKALNKDKTN